MDSFFSPGVLLPLLLFLLSAAGFVAYLIGHVWLLVQAFQESVGWGISLLLMPVLADVLFAIDHWVVAKRPFILGMIGLGLIGLSYGGKSLLAGYIEGHEPAAVSPAAVATNAPPSGLEANVATNAVVPVTDRERVAGMLQEAGIDVANPRTFQGRTIKDMTAALGPPNATMKVGGETTFIFHNCFEVVSSDGGRTVASVHYMGK